MTATLYHRGPNDDGYFESDSVSLGMRRLSIVDVEGGKQPIFNEDNTIAIVFNGEIFNFVELRQDLIKRGHQFRTDHSDTEVIVHLYEEYGFDVVQHLNGMFAFAIWDDRKKQLFLARDHAGIKPLYYTIQNGEIIFGSELKAIFAHEAVAKLPNYQALYHYFSLKNIPAPDTAFTGIHQLRAGEWGIFANGQLETRRWWRMSYSSQADLSEKEYADEIRRLLDDSVKIRMRTDVPFGAYLSGGIDSSSVVALMAQHAPQPIKTFSLVYKDNIQNKSEDQRFARMVSSIYSTDHTEYVMDYSEVLDTIEDVIAAFDEPFSGVTSTFFLTRVIGQHVKVAFSGDGADELFGSYLAHRIATPLHNYMALGKRPTQITPEELATLVPFEKQLDYLERLSALGSEAKRRMALYLVDDATKRQMLGADFYRYLHETEIVSTESIVDDLLRHETVRDPLDRALRVDVESLLPDQVLTFVDRLSMAHSVEVRPPFLDRRLMELSGRIPGRYKIRGASIKNILKLAVKGLVPDELLNRPKEGFILPLTQWMTSDIENYIRDSLSDSALSKHGLLNKTEIDALKTELFNKRNTAIAPRLWNVVMFQKWWERYFG